MDRTTVFTKTAKGLMEATGKTSHLSRDIRAVLKEVDGRATVELLQTRLGKMSEAKLQEALETLTKGDFVREFSTATSSVAPTTARTAPPPPKAPAAGGDEDLDFTAAIPTAPRVDRQAEEAAKQKAREAAEARAKAEAAARAKAEAEARAKAEAAARARAEAEAKAKALAAARAKAEAEAKAKAEAEARARAEAEARAKREAEERARKEAEDKAQREAEELRAKLEQERKAREEAERKAQEAAERERRAAEEKARREADELRAKIEEERKAREEAERKAKEEAERQRREAEEKARREADELRAKLEEERKAREEAERRAKEEAERQRREAEEKARREADELRAKLEEERRAREEAERKAKEEAERRAREEAERKAKEEAERRAREDAERKAKEEAERRAREEAERKAKEEAERVRLEAEDKARREAEEQARRQSEEQAHARAEAESAQRAREEAERKAREEAERTRLEAEERARRETEDKARREAEEAEEEAKRKAQEQAERERREPEEQAAQQPPAPEPTGSALDDLVKIETDFDAVLKASAGAPPEAAKRPAGPDDQLRKAAEELERRQAEEQARVAEEKARAKAKAEAEAESEAEAKRAEEEARRKSEGQERTKAAPVGAEEHLRAQAEAQALLDAQNAETERHFADMEKELEAEQAAAPVVKKAPEPQEPAPARTKKEAKESARAAAALAAAQAREAEPEFEPVAATYRPRINWGKPVALGLFLLIVLGLVLVNFISFDGSIPQFEKAAGAYLQQPVKIKALHLSLVPQPHWRLDGVSVGDEGQLKVAQVNAVAELGSMFSDKKAFSSIELESPVLGEQGFLGLLFGKPAGRDFKVASIVAKNAKLESKTFILPALDAKIALGQDGAWQKIALETPDHKTSLTLTPEGDGAALEVETNAFSLPFHPSFILENFVASGQLRRGELRLKEFKGGIFDGYLSGNANLKWGADWSLDGEISVRAMDPGKFAPALLDQGRLEGKAAYTMRAKSYDELYDAPRLEGTFDILKGNVLGIDLGRMLQGGGAGGKTAYAELTGGFVREAGRTQLRQINLVSGPVSASGSAEVDGTKRVSGRFVAELKSPVAHARANLTLTGTLQEPHFSR